MFRTTRKWKPVAMRICHQRHHPRCLISRLCRQQDDKRRHFGSLAALMVGAVAFLNNSPATSCGSQTESSPLLKELIGDHNNHNPLWPGGCREEDVDAFVEQVLQDPSINVPGIPDSVERIVYKSVTKLVLNIFYWLLSKVHGFSLLEHQVVLQKSVARKEEPLVNMDWNHHASGDKVDEEVLQRVADRLLASSAVNYALVPDAIERPLYINSLRLVFRLLDILASSFTLKVCGHVLLLDLVPLPRDDNNPQPHALSSSLTRIDLDKVREVARRHAGIVERDKSTLSFWQRLAIREEFLAQLHASIYALVLGIADDVMANAEIHLLSDKIVLDVVPCEAKEEELSDGETAKKGKNNERKQNESSGGFDAKSFLVGCGVGLTAAAAVLAAGKK